MNQTLVELGHAMLKGQNFSEFLWEYTIVHAAYLGNRAYMKYLQNQTLYQKWNKAKLNVKSPSKF